MRAGTAPGPTPQQHAPCLRTEAPIPIPPIPVQVTAGKQQHALWREPAHDRGGRNILRLMPPSSGLYTLGHRHELEVNGPWGNLSEGNKGVRGNPGNFATTWLPIPHHLTPPPSRNCHSLTLSPSSASENKGRGTERGICVGLLPSHHSVYCQIFCKPGSWGLMSPFHGGGH